jgi:hypothetical protein
MLPYFKLFYFTVYLLLVIIMMSLLPTKYATRGKWRDKGKDSGTSEGKDSGTNEGKDSGTNDGKDSGTSEGKDSGTSEVKRGIPVVLDGPSWQMGQTLPSFLILISRHDLQNWIDMHVEGGRGGGRLERREAWMEEGIRRLKIVGGDKVKKKKKEKKRRESDGER